MEYDFIYDRDLQHYSLYLASDQYALQQFILDELFQVSALRTFIAELTALSPYQEWQYAGREYCFQVHQHEVRVCHNILLAPESVAMPESVAEDDLQLDEHSLQSECGLVDVLKLLQAWLAFLPH